MKPDARIQTRHVKSTNQLSRFRFLRSNLALVASLCFILGAADWATALVASRPLATGNVMYALDGAYNASDKLVQINPVTGAGTPVGTPTPTAHSTGAFGAAFDPTSRMIYWPSTKASATYLVRTNPNTGLSIEIGLFNSAVGASNPRILALAVDASGNGFAIGQDVNKYVYSLNLNTGALTNRHQLNPITSDINCLTSFAYNPADASFYFSCNAQTTLRKLNVADGTNTLACTGPSGMNFDGIAFDSAGTGWASITRYPPNFKTNVLTSFDVTQSDCGFSSYIPMTVYGGWESYSLVIAWPGASTRAMPANNFYYSIDCSNPYTESIAQIDITHGIGAVLGSPSVTTHGGCGYGAAYDFLTGKAYWTSIIGMPAKSYQIGRAHV